MPGRTAVRRGCGRRGRLDALLVRLAAEDRPLPRQRPQDHLLHLAASAPRISLRLLTGSSSVPPERRCGSSRHRPPLSRLVGHAQRNGTFRGDVAVVRAAHRTGTGGPQHSQLRSRRTSRTFPGPRDQRTGSRHRAPVVAPGLAKRRKPCRTALTIVLSGHMSIMCLDRYPGKDFQ